MPQASERKYRSVKSSDKPLDLPNLRDELEEDGMVDLSIVIPAFNEVPRLPVMLKQALTHLSTSPIFKERSVEVVIVDDGSTDGTSEFALKLAGGEYPTFDIRVVTLEQNLGKGGAVRHGMMHTRGKRCLMVDADGASQFEDIDRLWEEMDRLTVSKGDPAAAAVVVGSRAHLVKTEAVVKVRHELLDPLCPLKFFE
jgi:dolichyl-phosphate beta-glucosyltransferase